MADEGELAFTASHVYPYQRYNVSLQPMPWLEGVFRYIAISNRLYGPVSLSGHQSYKDKSVDIKLRLWKESRYFPDVSLGARDFAGTGLFSGEYAVASKRFGPMDASLGIGWGYVGGRGDITNPFSLLNDRFNVRPIDRETGQFSTNRYFRGPAALFGGVIYQTPWEWLVVKAEYDGNDYRHEPKNDNQKQRSPINIGVTLRPAHTLDLSLAFERGTTIMFGITLHTNAAIDMGPAKLLDPPPPPRGTSTLLRQADEVDWSGVSRSLRDNAGIAVSRISRRGSELVVTGEQEYYFYQAKALGRAARVLDNVLTPSIDWYTLASQQEGLSTSEISIHRRQFDAFLDHDISLDELSRSIEMNAPQPRGEDVLYRAPVAHFEQSSSLTYSQSLGGPDAFLLYQIGASYSVDYHLNRNLWWSGVVNANLINNYDKFRYDAPSNLPRVRTDIRKYMTSSRLTMPVFQLTGTRQLGSDLYGLAYAGMLESMFGGIGSELLYRPFGERWAIGMDVNLARQRGYAQDFSFHRYHVLTGFVTSYLDLGYKDITLAVSTGRYLAGDVGATLDLSREFHNGVRMGAFATITNIPPKRFGEGSFDKGIYISIPFDLLLPRSTIDRATFVWDPLIRDGGARLNKRYSLYSLTSDRDFDNFNGNLDKISE
jgi:hypothetical protein